MTLKRTTGSDFLVVKFPDLYSSANFKCFSLMLSSYTLGYNLLWKSFSPVLFYLSKEVLNFIVFKLVQLFRVWRVLVVFWRSTVYSVKREVFGRKTASCYILWNLLKLVTVLSKNLFGLYSYFIYGYSPSSATLFSNFI